MAEPTHIHDHFFKALLAQPEVADHLLRERLPSEIVAILGPEPPEPVDGSFVDGEFREHLTDRLFRMKTRDGEETLIYLLVEHKSYPDRRTAFQLLRYLSRIWERMAAEDPHWERLPPILPLVVYHGEAQWRYPTEFAGLLNVNEALRPYCLDFRFTLVDLGQMEDHALSQQIRLQAGLMALKYACREGDQQRAIALLGEIVREIPEDFRYPFLLYLSRAFAVMDQATARRLFEQAYSKEDAPMWLSKFAQDLIAEAAPALLAQGEELGMEKGRMEGRQEEAASILLRLLQRRFGTLPAWVEKQIVAAETKTIEGWTDRLFSVQRVEDLFQ